jgi:PKHD-type hydroxylase
MRVGYFCIDEILTEEECDKIIEHGMPNLKVSRIMRDYDDEIDTEYRKGRNSFFDEGCEIEALLKRIVDSFAYFSQELFGCEINGVDAIQFTEYKPGDFYDWHHDQHGIGQETDCPERLVSATIELSDPEDYEGGGLEFFAIGDPVPIAKKARMIIFPSTMAHRARKVTKGTRYSLVMWGHRQ